MPVINCEVNRTTTVGTADGKTYQVFQVKLAFKRILSSFLRKVKRLEN